MPDALTPWSIERYTVWLLVPIPPLILVCPRSIVWLEGLVRRSEIVMLPVPCELETLVSVV